MKKIYSLFIAMILAGGLFSQSFTDDFESYSAGDYLAQSSDEWTTWSGTTGGDEDVQVVTDNVHSGSNSIYFEAGPGGAGPDDIVLPFDQAYDVGLMTFTAWFYVEDGNGAYYNFQAQEEIGQEWALEIYMVQNGDLICSNTDGQYLFSDYPNGEWFEMTMEINLTTNTWDVYVNGELKGSFWNSVNQIASVDIFPVNNASVGGNNQSAFWVDDVSYTYEEYTPSPLNAAVISLEEPEGLVDLERDVSVVVRNLGTTEIDSYDLTVDYGDQSFTQSFSDMGLVSLEQVEHTLNESVTLLEGETDLSVTISNVNGNAEDDDASDDSAVVSVDPAVPAPGKVVVAEEGTGTWCGWCPRGMVAMEGMEENYPSYFAGIAVHNNDPMVIENYDGPYSNTVSAYPAAHVDRGAEIDPGEIENAFLGRILEAPAAELMNGAEYDEETGVLTVSVTYNFGEDISGDWRVGAVLTEHNVTGTGSGYAQVNYYSGGAQGPMGGYENLPDPVPASQMVYDHVARAISPSFSGAQGVLPSSVEVGESHTYQFEFEIDEGWNMDEMNLIGLLIDTSGRIDNGSITTVNEALENGLEEGTNISGVVNVFPSDEIDVYPNPAINQVQISMELQQAQQVSTRIFDMSGKLVSSKGFGRRNGINKLFLPLGDIDAGMYMMEVWIGQSRAVKKLIVK